MTKLEKMLLYVSEHNDFYKNRIKEYGITNPLDINQWPILTRKELQENRYNMFSDGYKSKYFNQQLHRQSSSGSTGIPVNVYWDYKDWYASNMSLWRKRLQWYGIKPSERYVTFTLNASKNGDALKENYYINEPANLLDINISTIHDDSQYLKIVELINGFKPVWLLIQPFILSKLLQTYQKNNIPTPSTLRYIETVGELLSSDLKNMALALFRVPIANMYGSEEMNGIAYECPEHRMHILDDNVLIELRSDGKILQSGEGEALITNLNNFAMPLIRYNQKDRIKLSGQSQNCRCGFRGSVIDLISGRTHEVVKTAAGFEITSFMLMEMISEINNKFNYIVKNYHYIYNQSARTLQCFIKFDDDNYQWFGSVKHALIKSFSFNYPNNTDITFSVSQFKKDNLFNKKHCILEVKEGLDEKQK